MAKKPTNDTPNGSKPKMSREEYEEELFRLHGELVKLQYWIQAKGLKVVVVFEGRDAAGKGGVIKRFTDRVSPRIFRVVALPAPTEREKSEWFAQRYVRHFPAAGEVVLFDRSWYNRAGVERVMNFCTQEQYDIFLKYTPVFERAIAESGIVLIKYWFEVSMEEQERRFRARINDPRKTWKLSSMDLESYNRWYEYSRARDAMLAATHNRHAPWYLVQSDDKKRARLNCIAHFLSQFPYEELPRDAPALGKRNLSGRYDDQGAIADYPFIEERY
ncbi:polyphosphate kinase 2 [Ferrimonas sediminicola]|uniref:ADP/GDP-polyphosphate phosphotransferase n=1 Tax=Ferrimonas sediminicola TaxID=2569538 RepID=A0A4U1BCF3_9GAMM|nr:polyphosphate kinase 2 [Ferrimonas sediminicola]TKB48374.1 polyphosphate kinase 2 [Ferrimonas sediminicola]